MTMSEPAPFIDNVAGKLIFGWTEEDVLQAAKECGIDAAVVDETFLDHVSQRVHLEMDRLYALDVLFEVVKDVAQERANVQGPGAATPLGG